MSFSIIFSFIVFELLFFLFLSNIFGWMVTFLISISTMLIGGLIIRFLGMSIFRLTQYSFNKEELSLNNFYSSMWLLFAAALMIIPGFLSDLVGVFLLCFYGSKSLKKFILKNHEKTSSFTHKNI